MMVMMMMMMMMMMTILEGVLFRPPDDNGQNDPKMFVARFREIREILKLSIIEEFANFRRDQQHILDIRLVDQSVSNE